MKIFSKPKVSVIIPCYNRENYISDTITSVLNQTYENIEIITVDDGSTDFTRNILEEFGSKITILEHHGRVNKGQSAALNLGINNCSGKYIALLDSDDLFAPAKIETQVEFLENNPKIGLVYSNGFYIDKDGEKLDPIYYKNHVENSDPERVLMDCYFLVPNNSLVERSVFKKAGDFDESLRASQDHDMAIRLAEKTRLGYIDDHLFYYRRHSDSISAKNAELRWRNGFIILRKASRRYNYSFKAKRKRFAVLHFRIGQCLLENRCFTKAVGHFFISGLSDPARSILVLLKKESITSHH